jgi:aspartokinase-like uncharacterized kinase
MSRPIVVVKVGGSLLDWPELPSKLAEFLETRRGDRLVLVVGGGRFADVLRDLDALHQFGEIRSHALALRALDLTAHLLASLLPGTAVIEDVQHLSETWANSIVPILAPRRFLEADDRSPDPLPQAWTTTTDAIAARLAMRLNAKELVLLKSVTIPTGMDLRKAASLGLVDPEFPRAVEEVPVLTFRNFREVSKPQIRGTDPQPT